MKPAIIALLLSSLNVLTFGKDPMEGSADAWNYSYVGSSERVPAPDFAQFKKIVAESQENLPILLNSVSSYTEKRVGRDLVGYVREIRDQGGPVEEEKYADGLGTVARIVVDPCLCIKGEFFSLEILLKQVVADGVVYVEVSVTNTVNCTLKEWANRRVANDKTIWKGVYAVRAKTGLKSSDYVLNTRITLMPSGGNLSENQSEYIYEMAFNVLRSRYPATTGVFRFAAVSGLRPIFYNREDIKASGRVLRKTPAVLGGAVGSGLDGGLIYIH